LRSFLRQVKAEMLLVYAEVFRRKSILVMSVVWPYIMTAFMLTLGYVAGSPEVFVRRVGADPVLFLATASYILFSTLSVVDDVMWRPVYDEHAGTLPYVVSSPTSTVLHYAAIPVPRFTLSLVLGATFLLPVFTAREGFDGLLSGLIVVAVSLVAALTFIPLAVAVGLGLYSLGGESWRAINVIRPLFLVAMGVYYPRWMLSRVAYLVTALLPPSNCVEVVQRLVVRLGEVNEVIIPLTLAVVLAVVQLYPMRRSARRWEIAKLREGVKV
jgi:ABC-2 type transport system permease protein